MEYREQNNPTSRLSQAARRFSFQLSAFSFQLPIETVQLKTENYFQRSLHVALRRPETTKNSGWWLVVGD
jgi:hypothetical protein